MKRPDLWRLSLGCAALVFASLVFSYDYQVGDLTFTYHDAKWYVKVAEGAENQPQLLAALGTEETEITVFPNGILIPTPLVAASNPFAAMLLQVQPGTAQTTGGEVAGTNLHAQQTGQQMLDHEEVPEVEEGNNAGLSHFTLFNIWTAGVLQGAETVAGGVQATASNPLPANQVVNGVSVPLGGNQGTTMASDGGHLTMTHDENTDAPTPGLPTATVTGLTASELSEWQEWANNINSGKGRWTYYWKRARDCNIWRDMGRGLGDLCHKAYSWRPGGGKPKTENDLYLEIIKANIVLEGEQAHDAWLKTGTGIPVSADDSTFFQP